MKLCVAQFQSKKGDIAYNIAKHISFINSAVTQSANAIFFPELSITGYEPSLAHELATNENDNRFDVFQKISDDSQIVIGIGCPTKHQDGNHISMIIFQPNQSRQTYSKQYLHSDELPYFTNGHSQTFIHFDNQIITPAICYESLLIEHAQNAHNQHTTIYVASVAKSAKGVEKAYAHYPAIAQKFNFIVLMSNSVGISDDFISYGNSAIWNTDGKTIDKFDETTEGIMIYNTDNQSVIKLQL